MLYFDNAATTLQKPEEVAQAVKESFSYIGNAGRGANEASLFTSRLIFSDAETDCRAVSYGRWGNSLLRQSAWCLP